MVKNFAIVLPEAVVWHKYLNISMMSNIEGNCVDINNRIWKMCYEKPT